MRQIYFIAANLWFLAGLILMIGRNVARTQPVMYSFFGVGGWYYPGPYSLMVLACIGLGVVFIYAALRTGTDVTRE